MGHFSVVVVHDKEKGNTPAEHGRGKGHGATADI